MPSGIPGDGARSNRERRRQLYTWETRGRDGPEAPSGAADIGIRAHARDRQAPRIARCKPRAKARNQASGSGFKWMNHGGHSTGSQYKGNQDPLLEKVAMLPDGGWRQLLNGRLNEYIPDFNTPKFSRQRGKDLNGLFRQVLGIKMSNEIEGFLEEEGLCGRLDGIVTLRGEIAHTGDAQAEDRLSPDILRQHTASFIEAAAAVDVIIHTEFRNKLGFAPWQITQPIRQALRQVAQDKI